MPSDFTSAVPNSAQWLHDGPSIEALCSSTGYTILWNAERKLRGAGLLTDQITWDAALYNWFQGANYAALDSDEYVTLYNEIGASPAFGITRQLIHIAFYWQPNGPMDFLTTLVSGTIPFQLRHTPGTPNSIPANFAAPVWPPAPSSNAHATVPHCRLADLSGGGGDSGGGSGGGAGGGGDTPMVPVTIPLEPAMSPGGDFGFFGALAAPVAQKVMSKRRR